MECTYCNSVCRILTCKSLNLRDSTITNKDRSSCSFISQCGLTVNTYSTLSKQNHILSCIQEVLNKILLHRIQLINLFSKTSLILSFTNLDKCILHQCILSTICILYTNSTHIITHLFYITLILNPTSLMQFWFSITNKISVITNMCTISIQYRRIIIIKQANHY